jgi:hypothetical protein
MGGIGGGPGISVDSSEVIGPVPIREVKQVSVESLDGRVGNQTFVNEVSLPV